MAEKLMTEIQADFLTCSLCKKPYQLPKALPCLHSFCSTCLSNYIHTNAVPSGGNDPVRCFFCPLCRQIVEVPNNGVNGFHDNHLLRSLLDMMYSRVMQLCDVCNDEGKRSGAAYCCIKCEDFLCDECAATHKRTRVTRDHVVINVSMMKDMCLGKHNSDTKICVRLLTKIGSYGPELLNPIAVTTNHADDIIVSNNNDTITIYNQAGEIKKEIEQRQYYGCETKFLPNRGVSVTTEGFIAVAMRKEFQGNTCQIGIVETMAARQAGIFSVKTRSGKNSIPHGIATTTDNYTVITDVGKHCFYIFNPEMHEIKQVGKRGSKNSQFKSPFFVTINKKREILVSDYDNHCIKVFDLRGKYLRQFGQIGREMGQMMHPMGLCTDGSNNVFVCDRDNHRVQMFSADGTFLTVICQNTCKDGNDVRPQDVAMTTNGHLVVLVKGVEGVNFAEIHILQVGTRFTDENVEETKGQLAQLRQSLDFWKTPTPVHKANRLPPLGTKASAKPSAPYQVVQAPDILGPSFGGQSAKQRPTRGGATERPTDMGNFPHEPHPSAVCTIL